VDVSYWLTLDVGIRFARR